MKERTRQIACLGLTLTMATSFVTASLVSAGGFGGANAAAESGLVDAVEFSDVTGKVNLTSVALQNLNSSVIENALQDKIGLNETRTVLVTVNGKSLLSGKTDTETVPQYLATSAGKRALSEITAAQNQVLSQLDRAGVSYETVYRYSTVTNALALRMKVSDFLQIKNVCPSVSSAVLSETYAVPQTAAASDSVQYNASNVYATGIYNSSEYQSYGYENGMTVAILDTGLDYTHDAFRTVPTTLGLEKSDISAAVNGGLRAVELSAAMRGEKIDANDLYVSDKIPFAYDYADKDADVYPSYSQHGTHVAGIVAGQADRYTDKDGNTAKDADGQEIPFRGVAPNAQLVICKVFTDDLESKDIGGATSEDILAALEDCVTLGVDVINMSLGTTAGFSTVTIDGDAEGALLNGVYESIRTEGISLICAASNDYSSAYGGNFGTNLASNPDSGTVGSPSTFDGAVSVASINGQLAPYLLTSSGETVYYEESSDANSVQYDFAKRILDGQASMTYKYVMIPGIGQAADYTSTIKRLLTTKEAGEKVIAVIQRGTNTFEDKVQIATRMGADAVIVYNNVAGKIRMSLGDLENPVPAISVTLEAGRTLQHCAETDGWGEKSTGQLTVDASYASGPFMNDYSSWGTTPDLKLKPDVTAHGGEITSTVSGGYDEMSGTSMASPNLAGFTALLRGYLKRRFPDLTSRVELTRLTNQIMMSTATTVYSEDRLPYSPRKQGSGLATLSNVFTTNAYLYTLESEGGAVDDRPKYELGADEDKNGVYQIRFHVKNFGAQALSFRTQSLFMTETLSVDGLAVAEKAHMLTDLPAEWKVNGTAVSEGESFSVGAGESAAIDVTLRLSEAEKEYLDKNFVNGMFVEGFLQLAGEGEQCTLTLPFMGFYGDWKAAPMLDYDCYEIAAFEKDTSLNDNERPRASIWATQAYSYYYNEKYTLPIGGFPYIQDENAEQIYTDADRAAVSVYNVDNPGDDEDYFTSVGIKALYAGLLRNAEVVTYDLYNEETGELIKRDAVYRVGKAHSSGGSNVPAQVLLEFNDPEALGLVSNGKYRLDFHFYFDADDRGTTEDDNEENEFSMIFYVDYDAPVLVDSRIRYYDYKENNQTKQKVFLDLDVYDNHYAQSVLLCYSESDQITSVEQVHLATEYVTPVYNAVKNGTTTVSIDITNLYEKYENRLYVQVEDCALNHKVYKLSFAASQAASLPDAFRIVGDKEITLGVNQTYRVKLEYEGNANLSNFTWETSFRSVADVRNGEIFAAKEGDATITVIGKDGMKEKLTVHVVASDVKLPTPSISFGTIKAESGNLVKAVGSVSVNAGETFTLDVETTPWYYPESKLQLRWESSNPAIAAVDQTGRVTTGNKRGSASITARVMDGDKETPYTTSILLNVTEPFTVSNFVLTAYHGTSEEVVIPDDMNIMKIGEEAFKNSNVRTVIIPKTVTQISERAFLNCTNLEEVYFIQKGAMAIADAALTMIVRDAFQGCSSLRKLDFSNCKTFTLDKRAFKDCAALTEVVKMSAIGTMNDYAFAGCTSLREADLTGLHMSGESVFEGCVNLETITTDTFTAIGKNMFRGCERLGANGVMIASSVVSEGAFSGCVALTAVTFGSSLYSIGANAFRDCALLSSVTFTGGASLVGDSAFAGTALSQIELPANAVFGRSAFPKGIAFTGLPENGYTETNGNIYRGTTLIFAAEEIGSEWSLRDDTTAIADYAFSNSKISATRGTTELDLSGAANLTSVGKGAFAGLNLTAVSLPNLSEIADETFTESGLQSVAIPESVRSVGARAFKDCASLQTVTFVGTPNVKTIGEEAFSGTAIASVELPASVKEVGARAFYRCASLQTATLPAVEKLGARAFVESGITSVTFGNDAKTTGEGTFYRTPLQSVTLGRGIGEIGAMAFAECSSLTSIDLGNVEKVGTMAFSECSGLSVSGLNGVREIGIGAFYRCYGIGALDLSAAQTIGDYAFALDSDSSNGGYTSVAFGDFLREIGIGAFFGGKESSITLPASTERIGYGAFGKSENLTEISVAAENERYFSEDGVLYRAVSENEYELIAYPVARVAADKTYRIKDGTLTIAANAFAYVPATSVRTVVLPYSVLSIGDGAFYACNASEYRFESIQAPVLQTALREPAISGFFSLSYCNFKDELIGHTPIMTAPASSTVSILYPTNGVGYDNYVYRYYFGAKTKIGVLMNDTTRALKTAIEGFCSVDEVSSWNTLPVTEENKNEIRAFSEAVKTAHMNYEKIGKEAYSAEQLAFLGEENAEKLFAVEAALKSVKQRFGIIVTPATLTIAADSAHKSVYRSGERFSMEGLKLIVTYDDYSSEEADLSLVSVATGYDGALSELYSDVVLVGYGGLEVRVPITVTGENAAGEEETEDGGFNPVWVIVPVCAAAALAVGAVVTVVVIKKRKTAKYGASETESQPTDGATDDVSETESQPTDGADNPTDGATDQESQPVPEAVNQTEEDETRHE